MTTAAVTASESNTKNEARPVPASTKRAATAAPKPRAHRARTKKSAAPSAHRARASSVDERREMTAVEGSSPPSSLKTRFGTLLIGAGIGAAVTFSVMLFGTKRGRGSALGTAVTKSLTYAIAHTTKRGSLLNLAARAVESALG